MATMTVLDSVGGTQTVEKPLAPGQVARAASRPVTLATEDITALTATQAVTIATLPTLAAGTNNIGDVDVLSVIPGTAATNAGKAIDSAVGATDTGVGALVKRVDTLATLTPANGDWVPAQVDSTGAMWVRLVDSQVEVGEYEPVPSTVSTTTTLGTTGAAGDFLSSLLVTPLTVNPGSISIKDGSDAAILVFNGGTASVSNLVPFNITVGLTARNSGGWQVVTGSGGNVQALASGNFT